MNVFFSVKTLALFTSLSKATNYFKEHCSRNYSKSAILSTYVCHKHTK